MKEKCEKISNMEAVEEIKYLGVIVYSTSKEKCV